MGSRSIGDKRGWRILRNLLGWLTLSILKGGSLFAFERPEPEGVVLRDSPHFRFSYFPFLSNPAGPKFGVNPGTWRIPSTVPAR